MNQSEDSDFSPEEPASTHRRFSTTSRAASSRVPPTLSDTLLHPHSRRRSRPHGASWECTASHRLRGWGARLTFGERWPGMLGTPPPTGMTSRWCQAGMQVTPCSQPSQPSFHCAFELSNSCMVLTQSRFSRNAAMYINQRKTILCVVQNFTVSGNRVTDDDTTRGV